MSAHSRVNTFMPGLWPGLYSRLSRRDWRSSTVTNANAKPQGSGLTFRAGFLCSVFESQAELHLMTWLNTKRELGIRSTALDKVAQKRHPTQGIAAAGLPVCKPSRPGQMDEYFLPGLPGQWCWEAPSYSPEYELHISTPPLPNLWVKVKSPDCLPGS